jgi:hypothetical protein
MEGEMNFHGPLETRHLRTAFLCLLACLSIAVLIGCRPEDALEGNATSVQESLRSRSASEDPGTDAINTTLKMPLEKARHVETVVQEAERKMAAEIQQGE